MMLAFEVSDYVFLFINISQFKISIFIFNFDFLGWGTFRN